MKRIALFAILFLPILIYIYFALGVPKAFRAPVFGPRHAVQVKDKNGNFKTDTAYYTIPVFQGRTPDGKPFDSRTLDDRLYVAVFVQRDSASLLRYLEEDLRLNRSKWEYARFIFFIEGDSAGKPPAGAPDYAKDLKLEGESGTSVFLPPALFDSLRVHHYFVPDPARKKDPWQTPVDAVLIDGKRRIRGYYNLRQVPELKKLREDVPFILFHDEAAQTIEESKVEQKRK